MNLIDDPRIGIPLVLGFAALAVYASRCPNCGRWFSLTTQYREEKRQGKRRQTITGYSCRSCGASASRWSDFPRRGPAVPEGLQALPRWHPRVQWAIAPWRTAVVALVLLFLAGFVVFDPEVVLYPGHWQSYLEPYVEFLLDPLNGARKVTRQVRVAGGRWKTTRVIEECRERLWEGWEASVPPGAVVVERTARTRPSALAREPACNPNPVWVKARVLEWVAVDRRTLEGSDDQPRAPEVPLPPPGEAGPGVRRPGPLQETYEIDLQVVGEPATYTVGVVSMFRLRDRIFHTAALDRNLYQKLRRTTRRWDARVWWFSPRAAPQITLWVEDFDRFPD